MGDPSTSTAPKLITSELQLLEHDPSATAPERNYFSFLELDLASQAPEAANIPYASITPQEPIEVATGNFEEVKSLPKNSKRKAGVFLCGLSKKVIWIALCSLAALLAAGIGIGVGVRIGTQKSPLASNTTTVNNCSSGAVAGTEIPTPSATFKHGILNDLSFAALLFDDGSRYTFFQDISGNLRQAFFLQSSRDWTTNTNNIISAGARNHTPLTSVSLAYNPQDPTHQQGFDVFLFYIAVNSSLATLQFVGGQWNQTDVSNLSGYVAASGSRALSVSPIPNSKSDANSSEVLLFFENPDENITVLHDVSHQLYTSSPHSTFSSPFTTGPLYGEGFNGGPDEPPSASTALFFDPAANASHDIIVAQWSNGTFLSKTTTFFPNSSSSANMSSDVTRIKNSDILSANSYLTPEFYGPYGIWINGTTPQYFGVYGDDADNFLPTFPNSPFRYTRLATSSPANSTVFYLYHQINESSFAEDVWDGADAEWSSSTIPVATA